MNDYSLWIEDRRIPFTWSFSAQQPVDWLMGKGSVYESFYVRHEGDPKTVHASTHAENAKDFDNQQQALSIPGWRAAGSVSVGRGQAGVCRVPLVSDQHTSCRGISIWGVSLHSRTVATAIEVARGRGSSAACPRGIPNWGALPIGFLCLLCLALRAAPATAWRSRPAAGLRDAGWRGATSRSFPQTCQAADVEAFHKGLSLRGI